MTKEQKQGLYPFSRKAVIGVVHLKPLPGSPGFSGALEEVRRAALADAKALWDNGVDGLILENFGDAPFFPDRVDPHVPAFLAVLLAEVARQTDIPLGINILRNDGRSALGAAFAAGARFIRINVFIGAAVTDQGIIQGEAHKLLRYRAALQSGIAVLADVHVKHGRPLDDRSIGEAATDAYLRGRADGIVVTGTATGSATDPKDLSAVRDALPDAPLLAGSGITEETVAEVFSFADGAIVGTALKEGGDVRAPVDPSRVRRLVEAVRKLN